MRDADATLVIASGLSEGGTALTIDEALSTGRPLLVVDLSRDGGSTGDAVERIERWLHANEVRVLNVAGPRETECPGVFAAAYDLLDRLFLKVTGDVARQSG